MDLFFIVLTILIAPIVACPLKLFDGYIFPQIGTAAIGISIASLFWFYNGSFTISFATIAALIYFIYLMTSGAWSTVPHNSLREVPLIFLSVFSFLICLTLFQDKNNIMAVSLAVFCVSMFTSLYAIGQRFCFDPLFPERLRSRAEDFKGCKKEDIHKAWRNKDFVDTRAISTLGNTNFASGFFISTFPFLAYLSGEVSLWFLLSFAVVVMAIFCTDSRAGKLSIFVSLLSFVIIISSRGYLFDLLFYITELPIIAYNIIVFYVLLFAVAYGVVLCKKNPLKFLSNENDDFNTMLDVENDDQNYWLATLRYRLKYWKIAFNLIMKKPLQGYGLRTYRKEVYLEQSLINKKEGGKFLRPGFYQTPQPRECHNDIIENFVEGGIVGGLIFLSIVIFVLYNATVVKDISNAKDFFILSALIASFFGMLVEIFFFFPLRLGSSALMFWMSLALLQSFTKADVVNVSPGIVLTLFLAVMIAAMLWEGVIKPNLGNWYFTKYNFTSNMRKKEIYLNKAISVCPKESIFRTHMLVGYLEAFPQEADFHAEMLRNHYDGMIPAWASAYNCGIAKFMRKEFEDAFKFFDESLFFLPYFEDARNRLMQIYPLTPFKRSPIAMKQMTEIGVQAVRSGQAEVNFLQKEIQNLQKEIQNSQNKFCAVVLNEKLKLNIPMDWAFEPESCQFLAQNEIPPNCTVVQIGPTMLPLCIKKQQ